MFLLDTNGILAQYLDYLLLICVRYHCSPDPRLPGSPDALPAENSPQSLGTHAQPHVSPVRRVRGLQYVRVSVPENSHQHAARQLSVLYECR